MLHCGSFSKNLVAGFRVGCGGRCAQRAAHSDDEYALDQRADAAGAGGFSQHPQLRYASEKLRQTLAKRKQLAQQALRRVLRRGAHQRYARWLLLWITLPEQINATQLYHLALQQGISIAPGQLFSSSESFSHCFRFNTARHGMHAPRRR